MTVSSSIIRLSWIGDGTTTNFPITFSFYLASDITVTIAGSPTTTGFSITGGGTGTPLVPGTGTLVVTPAPAAGVVLQAILNVPLTQLVNLVDGTAFQGAVLNQVNDRAVMGELRLQDQISRTIRAPDGDANVNMLLPPAASRANLLAAFDANGNISPSAVLPPGQALSTATLAPFLNLGQTPAEIAANAVPVNLAYPPGHVDRYLTNAIPGSTLMAAGFQAAINQARHGGVDVVWGETAPYVLETPLDCTNCSGITFRQITNRGSNPPPPQGSVQAGALWVKHFGNTVFDLAGCNDASFYDLSLVTQNVNPPVATPNLYPKTCFFLSRTTSNSGASIRFHNTVIQGWFSIAILYNYASEVGVFSDNDWQNYAPDTGACVCVVTATNLFKGTSPGMTSSFATVLTGSQSCLSHEFRGGSYGMQNASATSDLFYVEGAVDRLRLLEFWCVMSNANGTTHGRGGIVYDDTTNGGANRVEIHGVHLENSTTQPAYALAVGPGTGAVNNWSIVDSFVNTATHDIQIDSTVLATGFRVVNLATPSGVPGLNAPGTVTDGWFDYPVAINIGTSTRNVFRNFISNITRGSHSADVIFDHTGALLLDASIGVNGAAAPGQLTGWGTPVGGAVINNYNITDAGGANSNTNKAVAQLIAWAKTTGTFGA